jgi:hypothetical protein
VSTIVSNNYTSTNSSASTIVSNNYTSTNTNTSASTKTEASPEGTIANTHLCATSACSGDTHRQLPQSTAMSTSTNPRKKKQKNKKTKKNTKKNKKYNSAKENNNKSGK